METSSKAKIILIVAGVFFLIICIAGRVAMHKQEKEREQEAEAIMEELEKDTVRTKEEIKEKLVDAITKNENDNVYMRIPGTFSEDDVKEIGRSIDPFLGRVTKYSYTTTTQKDGDGPEIKDYYVGLNYSYEKNDAYYVYESIVEGKDIPADKTKANKLADVCRDFMKQYITDGMTDYDKELAIHDYIVDNCTYSFSDDQDETEFEAYGALINHKAVCEGYAKATQLLLKCCNIDVKLVSGHANADNAVDTVSPYKANEDGKITTPDGKVIDGHMWNQVKIDNLWYNLDTTWDDPVGDEEILCHDYFNVDDNILRRNHEWDSSEAEVCSSTLANYYEKNGLYFKKDSSFKDYIKSELSAGNYDTIECAVNYPDVSEESMYFVFDYEGISSYQITSNGSGNYVILEINFNQ